MVAVVSPGFEVSTAFLKVTSLTGSLSRLVMAFFAASLVTFAPTLVAIPLPMIGSY